MRLPFILKLLASLLFIAALARVVSGPAFLEALRRMDARYVAASFGVSALMVLSSCLKWQWLVQHQGSKVPFRRLLRFYLIGYYFTNLLPSNMGGDVVRSYYAGREIGSQGHAAISVFMERVTGMVLLLLLVLFAPWMRPWLYRQPAVWAPAAGALALTGLLVWLWLAPRPLARVVEGYLRWRGRAGRRLETADRLERALTTFRGKASSLHERLVDSARRLKGDPVLLLKVALVTLLFYGLTWLNVWVSFRAFGVPVPLSGVAAVLPTAMVVAMLPLAPLASLGLAEGSYVFYFGLLGVAAPDALAMGLLLRLKLVTLGLLGLGCHLAPGVDRLHSLESPHDNAS